MSTTTLPDLAAAALTPDAATLPNPDRALFIRALLHLRRNGWDWTPSFVGPALVHDGRNLRITINRAFDWMLVSHVGRADVFEATLTSVQQAVNHLVDEDLLPREFHSLFVPLPQRTPDPNPPKPDFGKQLYPYGHDCPLCSDDLVTEA